MRKGHTLGNAGDEISLLRRPGAQAMIDRYNMKGRAGRSGPVTQKVEQSDAVGAARDSDPERCVARRIKTVRNSVKRRP